MGPSLRTPNAMLRTSKGFAYIALLVAIIIIGISLGATGKYWSYVSARDREEELLFRGNQYRQAIERYFAAGKLYPPSIDDLVEDKRTPESKHHLRKKYKDPITGLDFIKVLDPRSKRLIGVLSRSGREPFKKENFDESYADHANKSSYYEWAFVARAQDGQKPLVVQVTIPAPASDGNPGGGRVITVMQPVMTGATPTAQQQPISRPGRRRIGRITK